MISQIVVHGISVGPGERDRGRIGLESQGRSDKIEIKKRTASPVMAVEDARELGPRRPLGPRAVTRPISHNPRAVEA